MLTDGASVSCIDEMPDKSKLIDIGFKDIGQWFLKEDEINYTILPESVALAEVRNALYAFCDGDSVLYIGKTTMSIVRRFVGYRRPGNGRQTNFRNHHSIIKLLQDGKQVRILCFPGIADGRVQLQYDVFIINLAAGLEDSLILEFNPPWNGGRKEAEENEMAVQQPVEGLLKPIADQINQGIPLATFQIELGPTYFKSGYINPGVVASRSLGVDGMVIAVYLGNDEDVVLSKINRTANRTGAVRILGSNAAIARWFQTHFKPGDIVEADVLTQHSIKLRLPRNAG